MPLGRLEQSRPTDIAECQSVIDTKTHLSLDGLSGDLSHLKTLPQREPIVAHLICSLYSVAIVRLCVQTLDEDAEQW
jgi:hypothetical protein